MIIIAIATNGGHVSRALDFYRTEGKYFIVGGTQPWTHEEDGQIVTDDTKPDVPQLTEFKLRDVIALKRVEENGTYLVVPYTGEVTDEDKSIIKYREQNWRKVSDIDFETELIVDVVAGATSITVASVEGANGLLKVHSRIRINNEYEATITEIVDKKLTLDTPAPSAITAGAKVLRNPYTEGARYVYVECYLNYDNFPIVPSYRQIGLCTGVSPNTVDVLRSAAYSGTGSDEYADLGILEILDNRIPSARNINQRELLSIIVEF